MSGRHATLHDNLKWVPPPLNWIKINADAEISSDGRLELATIIKDNLGTIIVADFRCITGLSNAFFGESVAALMGIQLL